MATKANTTNSPLLWSTAKKPLPASWKKAAGMMKKGQRKELEKHVRRMRREWEGR